jgi:hypothetical protein
MSEAMDLIYDVLDVISGKKQSVKKTGAVDLLDTVHARERRAAIIESCQKNIKECQEIIGSLNVD